MTLFMSVIMECKRPVIRKYLSVLLLKIGL